MQTKKLLLGKILPLLISFSVFLYSCEKENSIHPTTSEDITPAEEVDKLKSFLSEATGTSLHKIIFDDDKKRFAIDGDVIMSLTDARDHYTKFQTDTDGNVQGKTKQRSYMFLMSKAVANSITIYISPGVPGTWVTAIGQAVNNWNNTDTQVRASITPNAVGARITVTMSGTLAPTTIALATFPDASGNSGPSIQINPQYNNLIDSRKQFAITHELGHCFGFMHTDQLFGSLIPNTPASDPLSVMNSTVLDWTGFTFYDFIGYGVVYPNIAGTKHFLRYYNTSSYNHFYTTNPSELGPSSGSWIFEGSVGYIYPSAVSGTVSLYQYYNTINFHHFYTTNFSELGGGGSGGWVYQGVAGYVSPTQVAGTKPLYRYFNTSVGDHFYTTNFSELGGGSGSWTYIGIQCYVW